MSGCGVCPHISKPVFLPSFTHQHLKSLQRCLYTNPPSSSLIALFQIRLKRCSRDMKWVWKKIPRKGISNHPPPIRHHTIAAEIHRPDLLLRHLESHHHQPPGDSSFESTTFACGALMIEICVTNIASAESTRMTSSSCHRKALNRQDLYDLSDPYGPLSLSTGPNSRLHSRLFRAFATDGNDGNVELKE